MGILKKKGQAALEFLTTYGWAFMVILVMIGALAYFGVLNPQKLIPDQCAITSGFTCSDFQVSDASKSGFTFINNMGEPITVSNFVAVMSSSTVIAAGACTPTPAVNAYVADGSVFSFASCTTTTGKVVGSKIKMSYSFDYVKQSGSYPHTVSGSITATLK